MPSLGKSGRNTDGLGIALLLDPGSGLAGLTRSLSLEGKVQQGMEINLSEIMHRSNGLDAVAGSRAQVSLRAHGVE